MDFDSQLADGALLKLIGERLARIRLARNLTQGQLAEQAGLGLRTVQRLELGATASQLTSFVRVCRVLGLVESFDALIPEEAVSPIEQLKLHGKKRQRASGTKKKAASSGESTKWTWEDDG